MKGDVFAVDDIEVGKGIKLVYAKDQDRGFLADGIAYNCELLKVEVPFDGWYEIMHNGRSTNISVYKYCEDLYNCIDYFVVKKEDALAFDEHYKEFFIKAEVPSVKPLPELLRMNCIQCHGRGCLDCSL